MDGCARSEAEMLALGRQAADLARPGAVFALSGGLGAGKTHWTKGLAAALGCTGDVTSPTFGLVHEYQGTDITLYHLDFYRLEHADELLALGWDEYLDADGVIVAEWAEKFPEILPPGTIHLRFTVAPDNSRTVTREA